VKQDSALAAASLVRLSIVAGRVCPSCRGVRPVRTTALLVSLASAIVVVVILSLPEVDVPQMPTARVEERVMDRMDRERLDVPGRVGSCCWGVRTVRATAMFVSLASAIVVVVDLSLPEVTVPQMPTARVERVVDGLR